MPQRKASCELENELLKSVEEKTPEVVKSLNLIDLNNKEEFTFVLKREHLYKYDKEKITGYDFKLTSIRNSPNELYKLAFEKSGIQPDSDNKNVAANTSEINLPELKQFKFDYNGERHVIPLRKENMECLKDILPKLIDC